MNPAPDPTDGGNNTLRSAHLRVARPTDALAPLLRFYGDGLGFDVLGEFQDHDGFDGVMLGHGGAPYHLEFTHQPGHSVGRAPSDENLLVFYIPEMDAWRALIDRLGALGYVPVPARNPYWDRSGVTFADPDGYRVVLQRGEWPP